MKYDLETVAFQSASLEEVLPLRQAVIIAGTDRDSPYFDGDDHESTRHFAAVDGDRVVGCASCYCVEYAGKPAWQLRGMATDPDYRGRGVGKALLAFIESTMRTESDIPVMWCNAREAAAEFYSKQGWWCASDVFEIPGVGMHFKMVRKL